MTSYYVFWKEIIFIFMDDSKKEFILMAAQCNLEFLFPQYLTRFQENEIYFAFK